VKVGDISGFEASSYPGRAKAVQEVDLAFEVPGQLVELAVKDGDQVERGQLLARIDAREYQAKLLAAQGAYDTARVNYERAEALVREEALATITRDERRALMDVRRWFARRPWPRSPATSAGP
jgi:multidrug efflux pump subunit AcrA (membrane-fusion protein)